MEQIFLSYGIYFIVGCGVAASLTHVLTLWGQEDRLKIAIFGEDLLKHEELDKKDKALINFFLNNAFNHLVPIAFAIASPFIFLAFIILSIKGLSFKSKDMSDNDCLKCVYLYYVTRNYLKMAPISTFITLFFMCALLLVLHQFQLLKRALFEETAKNNILAVENRLLQRKAA